jgi:hypothetical protein
MGLIMQDIESLIKKGNLSRQELDSIILRVKQELWPRLKQQPLPEHCGACELYDICRLVNSELICPW